MISLRRTDLEVFPLCLGGNVFGWTADEARSRAVLDAYAEAGGDFVDTANSYLVEHGRSETIIGRWLADRATATGSSWPRRSAAAEGPSATCARRRSSAKAS
jgi:aryl-alcohol dehydrogenase-like predicted oxidoreductase